MDLKENVSKKIVKYRKENNLTQKELASKLNVSSQLISKWEKGEAVPSLEYIVDMCKIFSCSLDEFVGENKVTDNTHKKEVTKEQAPKPEKKNDDIETSSNSQGKDSTLTITKPVLWTLISVCLAILLTGLIFLTIYTIVPASNRNKYIANIESSIEKYLNQGYFSITISGKADGETQLERNYLCNVDENGVDFQFDREGYENGVADLMVDGVQYVPNSYGGYYSDYAYKYIPNNQAERAKEIFENNLTFGQDFELSDVSDKDISYIRKTSYGYYIRLNKDLFTENMSDTVKENIKVLSPIKGKIVIEDDIFVKMSITIKMKVETDDGDKTHTIESSIEFKSERPIITKEDGDSVAWLVEETELVNVGGLLEELYPESGVNKITELTTSEISDLRQAMSNGEYKAVGNRLFWLDSGDLWYFDINTKQIAFSDFSDYTETLFYDNYLVAWDNTSIHRFNLSTMEGKTITHSAGISLNQYIIHNNVLLLFNSTTYSENKVVFYNMANGALLGKSRTLYDMRRYLQTDKGYMYVSGNTSSYGSDSTIYKYNINTAEESYVGTVFDKTISSIKFIDSSDNLFYSLDSSAIYRYGSSFVYKYGTISEKDGEIHILSTDGSRVYVYSGDVLIRTDLYTSSEESSEEGILDNDKYLGSDGENHFIKDENRVYHVDYNSSTMFTPVYINRDSSQPKIVAYINEKILVQFYNVSTSDVYLAIFDKSDWANVECVAIAERLSTWDMGVNLGYASLGENLLIAVNNELFLVSTNNISSN